MRPTQTAFTLIELLVVVTIIVILLALLTPALDKAIYQAELASCAARHEAVASGATIYATEFNRSYPDRPEAGDRKTNTHILHEGFDYRPVLRNHIPLKTLVDPLVQEVDLTVPSNVLQSSFTALWFDTRYPNHRGMRKLGDRFTWTGTSAAGQPEVYEFNLLAGDADYFIKADDFSALVGANDFNVTSHPDDKGVMTNGPPFSYNDDTNQRFSYWLAQGSAVRGAVDFNYAFADGSVLRLDRVKTNEPGVAAEEDDRVVSVPVYNNAWEPVSRYQQIPRP